MTQQILASTQVGCALPYSICDERTTALVPDFDFSAGNSNGVFAHGRLRPSKFIPGNYLFTCSATDQKTLKLSFAMRSFLHSCNFHAISTTPPPKGN